MDRNLSSRDRSLSKAVDEVLYYKWDPICASDEPRARDEYERYAPQVFGLLRNGASADAIASLLRFIAVSQLGVDSRESDESAIAELLVRWREAIDNPIVP